MANTGPARGPSSTPSAPAVHPSGAEDLRLPKPPGFIRSYFNRHPWLLDSLIAGAYVVPMGVFALVLLVRSLIDGTPLLVFANLYGTAAVGVGLLFRRHVPVITAAICAGSMIVLSADSRQLDVVPMMFALYALAVYRSARSAWIWTAIGVATGVAATVLHSPGDLANIVGSGVLFALVLVIATLVGITFGNRRRYIEALLDRAAQLARERDQRAQLAAAEERARIARELHDIVAHSLTVIVALSDGAEASIERSPDAAREAVRQTAATARRALTDMRRSLGVLTEQSSEGSTPFAPQPGAGDLSALIESFRAAGLPVRYTTTGMPAADPVLQLTVYRVVQEALTNALRYALQPTAVEVRIDHSPAGATVDVLDDGLDPGRGAASAGSGRGLIGIRERAAVHGGGVTAGPAGAPGSRGWRVRAVLGAPGPATRPEPMPGPVTTPGPVPVPGAVTPPWPAPGTRTEHDGRTTS